ncbi:MAG: tRNA pseudouridine(55) synthase TruB [Bacilli bacterium]|nr:tRNA pseudouridine(55) synthase TruB [Bacilli bacterium]
MDGIILINKEKGITSRDVVNKVSKKMKTKHVGHAGTLDPLATGLMIIGVGKGTKILELLTQDKKEYIATVKMGLQTDTFDITGNVIQKVKNVNIKEMDIINALNYFKGEYLQTVPKYSAVKINGKKLYEYARNNIDIVLPKRQVTIYEIELISINLKENEFTFRTLVSKGTYIRSLINDIGEFLNIPMTMQDLIRTKSGKFKLSDSNKIEDDLKYISIPDSLDFKIKVINDEKTLKRVKNGNDIELTDTDEYLTLVDENNNLIAIYKKDEFLKFKAFKVF